MAEIEGRNVRVAKEVIELMRYINARTHIKLTDQASILILAGLKSAFPKMVGDFRRDRPEILLEAQLTGRVFPNEKGNSVDPELENPTQPLLR